MLKKIQNFIEKYDFISSLISISLIVGFIQIISYIKNTAYYNYFNISSSFISLNIFENLEILLNNLFIITILICEIYIVYDLIIFIYNNRSNLKKFNSIIKVIFLILLTISMILLGLSAINTYFNFYLSGTLKIDISSSIICIGLGIILAIIKIGSMKIKSKETREEIDQKVNTALWIISIVCFLFVIINGIKDLGELQAKNQKTFLINTNENKIILYNDQNMSILANYDYNEKTNTLIIYTSELEKIDNDNMKFSTKTFDEVKVEY